MSRLRSIIKEMIKKIARYNFPKIESITVKSKPPSDEPNKVIQA